MEPEQIKQRMDWLDEERRKDKTTVATLEERLATLEGGNSSLSKQFTELIGEVARLSAITARMDQMDTTIAQLRVDFARMIEGIEKKRTERDREFEKNRQEDQDSYSKSFADFRKGFDSLGELKKTMQLRIEEEYRLGREIEDLEKKFESNWRDNEEFKRNQKLLDEGRRQDTKRLADLQGEIAAFRKRMDELRGKTDLLTDSLRKLELRIGEFQNMESERRQEQAAFLQKQNLLQVERDRTWKEWQGRFDEVSKQTIDLEGQMQALDATHRAVKRAQETFDEVNQRLDRRVNEITEMQRLVEERFRQEWSSFKADDQKRWTNYTLSQEEQQKETGRNFDKANERVVSLEDTTQEIRDTLHQFDEETQRQMQALLSVLHQWLEGYDRTFGRNR